MPAKIDNPDAPFEFTGSLVRCAQQRNLAVWQSQVSTEITSVQYAALEILRRSPGVNQRQLGDQFDVDRSTIADLVARMVRNELIERSDDPVDKRSYVLFLTPAGKKQLSMLRPRVEEVEQMRVCKTWGGRFLQASIACTTVAESDLFGGRCRRSGAALMHLS